MLFSEREINLSEEGQTALVQYISEQINSSLQARFELEEQWREYIRLYETGRNKYRNGPWEGSCNIGVTLIATAIESIYARIMNTVLSMDPPFICKPLNSRFVIPSKKLQQFIEWASEARWGTKKMVSDVALSMLKLGIAFAKVYYKKEEERVFRYNDNFTDAFLDEPEETFASPTFQYIPIEDLLFPAGVVDFQKSPWIAHRSRYTWDELQEEVVSQHFPGNVIDSLKGVGESGPDDDFATFRTRIEGAEVQTALSPYHLWEWWGKYDIDGDGKPEKIVATVSLTANKLIRVIHHPYFHRRWPFQDFTYMPREGSVYGIGIAEMGADYQVGVTTMTCQRIDNSTISNTVCFKGRKGSGIRPKEKVYPAKVFLLDSLDDLQTFQLGSPYNSTVESEALLRQYFERRTGVSDYSLGRESEAVGTKATATATLALIQEGTKRFDLVIRNLRNGLAECATQAVQLYQQFKPRGEMYVVLGPAGLPMEEIMNFPQEFIRSRVSIIMNASSASQNREISKQNDLALFGILGQYQQRELMMVQAVFQSQSPEIQQVLIAQMQSMHTLFERILENYDIKDTEVINPNILEILNGQAAQGTLAGDVSATGMGSVLGLPQINQGGGQISLSNGENGGRFPLTPGPRIPTQSLDILQRGI